MIIEKQLILDIRFGRYSGGGDNFYLTIIDKSSTLHILNIAITPEEVANLISLRQTNANGILSINENIGKKHEVRKVGVKLTENFKDVFVEAERLNPGWIADTEEHMNSHRLVTEGYLVTIRRWV